MSLVCNGSDDPEKPFWKIAGGNITEPKCIYHCKDNSDCNEDTELCDDNGDCVDMSCDVDDPFIVFGIEKSGHNRLWGKPHSRTTAECM